MRHLYRSCVVPALALLLCAAASAETTVLPNGLRSIVLEGSSGDVCGVHVALDVGPERVPAQKAGLRALVQQVLLSQIRKAMDERPELKVLQEQGTQGAGFSVETQEEHVEFLASVTTAELPRMLEFLAASIFDATWTQDDVVAAREMIDRREADAGDRAEPYKAAFTLFVRALRGDSAYTQPVMGTAETRAAITLADVTAFYKSYYAPGAASVCVVSPLPAPDAADMVRAAFGAYAPRDVAPARPVVEAGGHARVQVGSDPGLRAAVMVVGIPVPPPGTADYAVAQVVQAALSGPAGLLAGEPEEGDEEPAREGAAPGPGPTMLLPVPMIQAPYLAIVKTVAPNALEQGRLSVMGHLATLAVEPLDDKQLARAKRRSLNALALSMSDPLQAATEINRRFIVTGAGPEEDRLPQMISQVTASQVQEFAHRQTQEHAIGIVLPGS